MKSSDYYKIMYDKIHDDVTRRGDVVMNEDGYYVFWPKGSRGFITATELRVLADVLDDMNKEWDETVHKELSRAEADHQGVTWTKKTPGIN